MCDKSDNQQDYEVIDNTEQKRFVICIGEQIALEDDEFFTTSQGEKGLEYKHTEVPKALGGQGIVGYLVKHILEDATAKGLIVEPTCPYVNFYIDKRTISLVKSMLRTSRPVERRLVLKGF